MNRDIEIVGALTCTLQLSYYISTMGFARALYLLFLLPCKVSFFSLTLRGH